MGCSVRPSGWAGLFGNRADTLTDDMWRLGDLWSEALADTLYDRVVAAGDDDDAIIAAIETGVRDQLRRVGTHAVDPAMSAFEVIAREDSTMRVADAANSVGLAPRALERRCCATFGMTPKAVLRRSRFLDLAAAIRGLSQPDEEEQAAAALFGSVAYQSRVPSLHRHDAGCVRARADAVTRCRPQTARRWAQLRRMAPSATV